MSAEKGYMKIVEILLKKSADPNYQSEISGNYLSYKRKYNIALACKEW